MNISKHLNESITNVSGQYNEVINEAKKGGKNSFSIKDIQYLMKLDAAFVDTDNPRMIQDVLFNDGGSYSHRRIYCGGKWYIHKYNGSMYIVDLTNAMKRGKFIKKYTIYKRLGSDSNFYVSLANYCQSIKKDLTLNDFIKLIVEPMMKDQEELIIKQNGEKGEMMGDDSVTIGFQMEDDWVKGINMPDPYKIPSIKPLTKFPNKWKIADLIKVIANGQYIYLGRDYKYTDDYAYDAAYGGKIDYLNPIKMVMEMIEHPEFYKSMWVTTPIKGTEGDDKKVTISFGMTNTSYTITVALDEVMTPNEVIKRDKAK